MAAAEEAHTDVARRAVAANLFWSAGAHSLRPAPVTTHDPAAAPHIALEEEERHREGVGRPSCVPKSGEKLCRSQEG